MFAQLNPNSTLTFDKDTYHFENPTIDRHYSFRNRMTGYSSAFSQEQLREFYCDGKLTLNPPNDPKLGKVIPTKDFMSLSEDLRAIAWKRYDVLGAIMDAGTPANMRKTWPSIIAGAAQKAGFQEVPSWQTVRLWRRRYENGGLLGLVPDYESRGSNVKLRCPAENAFIGGCIKKYFLQTKASVKSLWKAMEAAYLKAKHDDPDHTTTWSCPSENTVRRIVNKISPYEVARRRHGKKYADRLFMNVQQGTIARYRMEIVEIDHTMLDTWVIDLPSGIVLGRPYLTVAIDRYSRMIVGIYVGLEPPGAFATMQCLRHMIVPKIYMKREYPDINIEWPDAGVPITLMSDNDTSFKAESVRTFCASLQITMRKGPAWRPDYRGIIERVNRTFKESSFLDLIPGKALRNPRDFKEYDPRKDAVITLPLLRELIHEWILCDYMYAEHSGIMDIPLRIWQRDDKEHPIRLPVSIATLDLLAGIHETRQLGRKGIEFLGLRYNIEGLNDMLRRGDGNKSLNTVSIPASFRVNPADLSKIGVYDPVSSELISVPCLNLEYTRGLTLYEHKFIRKKTRQENRDYRDIAELKASKIRWITTLDKILDTTPTTVRRDIVRQNGGINVTQPATDVSDARIRDAIDRHSRGMTPPDDPLETYGMTSDLTDEFDENAPTYEVRE